MDWEDANPLLEWTLFLLEVGTGGPDEWQVRLRKQSPLQLFRTDCAQEAAIVARRTGEMNNPASSEFWNRLRERFHALPAEEKGELGRRIWGIV